MALSKAELQAIRERASEPMMTAEQWNAEFGEHTECPDCGTDCAYMATVSINRDAVALLAHIDELEQRLAQESGGEKDNG